MATGHGCSQSPPGGSMTQQQEANEREQPRTMACRLGVLGIGLRASTFAIEPAAGLWVAVQGGRQRAAAVGPRLGLAITS